MWKCQMCHTPYTITDGRALKNPKQDIVIPHNNEKEFLKDVANQAAEYHWFHATLTDPERFSTTDPQIITHVGRPETCIDYLSKTTGLRGTIWVHELALRPGTLIDPELAIDINNWSVEIQQILQGEVDGFAYVNRWEAPGTASLLVSCECLMLVDSYTMDDFKEWNLGLECTRI